MEVAICFRGEIRGIEVMELYHRHLYNVPGVNFTFFYAGHKTHNERNDNRDSVYDIDEVFSNAGIELTSLTFLPIADGQWMSAYNALHLSLYTCNKLKREYEYNNNMEFDAVLSVRTDVIFKQSELAECLGIIDQTTDGSTRYWAWIIPPRANAQSGIMHQQDIYVGGSSMGMDVVCNGVIDTYIDNANEFTHCLNSHGGLAEYMLSRRAVPLKNLPEMDWAIVRPGVDTSAIEHMTLDQQFDVIQQHEYKWLNSNDRYIINYRT